MRRLNLHRLAPLTAALIVAIVTASCGQSTPAPEAPSPTVSEAPPEPPPEPPPAPKANSQEITTHGIGPAQLGLTLSELQTLLGPRTTYITQSPFLADFDAIAVRQNGDILFHILHLAGEPMGPEDIIQGVLTANPAYKTAGGVGVGTPIAEAEARYGDATLSRHAANSALEYVQFQDPPAANISFGTQPADALSAQDYAGLYPEGASDYQETTEYRPDATIGSVLVVCLNETCAGES